MSIIDYFAMNVVPKMYRGKGALHPAATGELGFGVRCVREYDVNIFFIQGDRHLVAIDAGYKNYPRLGEKCRRIGVDPADVTDLFLTHADPDHAGGLDARCVDPFKNARIYLGKLEENYLTNTWHRKKIGPIGLKNPVRISKEYRLLEDASFFSPPSAKAMLVAVSMSVYLAFNIRYSSFICRMVSLKSLIF